MYEPEFLPGWKDDEAREFIGRVPAAGGEDDVGEQLRSRLDAGSKEISSKIFLCGDGCKNVTGDEDECVDGLNEIGDVFVDCFSFICIAGMLEDPLDDEVVIEEISEIDLFCDSSLKSSDIKERGQSSNALQS